MSSPSQPFSKIHTQQELAIKDLEKVIRTQDQMIKGLHKKIADQRKVIELLSAKCDLTKELSESRKQTINRQDEIIKDLQQRIKKLCLKKLSIIEDDQIIFEEQKQ